ncbi:hypothetical protein Tsp_04163 [Trichinella spiralis]|uniref:hypothetical protein n=1 Tax=Trichinella spiralis TaxID=6334 RepID=UPI0001EFB93E|nr:hypothetical protein Tsp_04163 [Trichinella spiralis]
MRKEKHRQVEQSVAVTVCCMHAIQTCSLGNCTTSGGESGETLVSSLHRTGVAKITTVANAYYHGNVAHVGCQLVQKMVAILTQLQWFRGTAETVTVGRGRNAALLNPMAPRGQLRPCTEAKSFLGQTVDRLGVAVVSGGVEHENTVCYATRNQRRFGTFANLATYCQHGRNANNNNQR